MNQATETTADEALTLKALTALAQAQRLRIFKALVVAGQDGLTPGVLAEQLGSTPSGLSFHLKELAHSGLIDSEQRGRNLIYRANFARMNGVLAYLTEHCCQGTSCEVSTTAGACTTC
ncbi:metalloregulator ArsR/SmtB family transcription factor [Rhodoferax sp. TBRC 17660]|uniref:Metalloregulator ArsR/SmtB family transcription factor n=1 Tax=Rhodoferax potami TaxID=3068338 RepID=A0ABU3KQV9_9BURK|nr:metalloregulator ArsR/SmtB family transcription factor [Rhodoferax sp. TBRC 17660]MDT7520194.1 metalloregulator ArsR/SmtB family transcription factor [Rhodoferax sp. TBRC 17660]